MKVPERIYIDGTKREIQNMAFTAYSFDFLGHVEYIRKDLADKQVKELAQMIIATLEEKALDGCKDRSWSSFENGNGENVGKDIDNLIELAKKIINSRKAQTE